MSPTISVIVAEENPIYAAGFESELTKAGLQVLATAPTSLSLLQMPCTAHADVVILNSSMTHNEEPLWLHLRRNQPAARLLLVLEGENGNTLRQAIDSGVLGFMLKSANTHQLVQVIHRVNDGALSFCPGSTPLVKKAMGEAEMLLTAEEEDLLLRIAKGQTSEQIGAALFRSPFTINKRRKKLQQKLGMKGIAGLIRWAMERKML